MDRIIEIKVNGSYLSKDNDYAGVQHESNAKTLRIEFDPGWDGYAKTVTFWDALGENPVKRTLTADLLEDLAHNTRIYLCKIPGEAMTEEGKMSFVIDGYADGVRHRSIAATLKVSPAEYAADASEPTNPTPSQAEQLQVQIDTILQDMSAEADRAETAKENAENAQQAAETAQGKAEVAQRASEAAQGKSEAAQAAAETAQSKAEAAQQAAETARSGAETAQRAAQTAQAAAETAQSKAETAQAGAVAARDKAREAQQKAQQAASETVDKVLDLMEGHVSDAAAAADRAEAAAGAAANETKDLLASYVNEGKTSAQEAAGSAAAAEASAKVAEQHAQSVDPDEIRSQIASKGDNLEFDTETSLLWMTSGGERIGDGIKVATSGGGGGGGGESNNATLTLKNTTGWIYKSIAYGAECPISFEWSSLEDEMETGSGVLKITVAGSVKHTSQITQGAHTIDIGPYLSAGSSTVKVNVTDVYGNSRSLSFNLTAVELTLASTFDATVAYSGEIAFPYTPTAAVEKTVYFKMDGTVIGKETVTASGRQQTFNIPAQSHGCHQLDVWFEAVVDGEIVPSNHLYYSVICTVAGNTTPIIAVGWRKSEVEQFDTLAIPFIAYDPASLTASVTLHSSETGDTTPLTVDRTRQIWSYRVETAGELTLTISCIGADLSLGQPVMSVVKLDLTSSETTIEVNAETNDLSLHLSSYGRSNNEGNPSEWKYGNVSASLTGFNYTSDGWVQDEDGITVLRVGGDARVEIPVQIFAKDFRTTGKTIEIEFASRSVLDYDAVIATCWTGDRGFVITAQQATLRSEKSEVFTNYKEDDHLRLSFVIEKRSGNRLIIGYVNGIISGMVQYPDTDDFSQAVPVNITLGSNECTLDVYNIRIYENDLTRFQLLDNWIADTQELGTKKDRYDRNNIFDEYGQILPTTLRPHQCYLVLNCPVLPTYKGDKKTCSGQYVDPVHPERSFTFTGAEIDVQGTSSQYYYVKNFKIKFKGGFKMPNGQTSANYAMNAKAVPTNEFTFKADVASSEGANNVVLAELYNDLCPVKTPAQVADPRVRQCIEGHPIVVFHDAGSGAKFIGKYNFNNDKGTAEVFGFTGSDESWEILENGNALVSFKSADFSNWKTAFEARYPDKNTNITRLQQFVTWVASTDTTAAGLTDEEKAARLQKFKDEIADWANVEDAIFYYLFTLIFLCIDQREKNAFPTWNEAMAKWIWLFYDADSSIGTDNKGNLTFEYWMEDIDYTEAGDPVFNGQNNVFWSNLRECFPDEIRDEYRRLRTEIGADGKALLSFERVDGLFSDHQGQWSEAIFNEDAWRKAVEPLEKVNDPQYLPMQQGKKEQHFNHWMYNRFRYLDSKFETGAALDDENRIMMRAHAQGNIWLTSYINMYGQVYFNAERSEERMVRDTAYEFEWTAQGAEDAVIGVNSAPMITSLGDLSPLMLEYCHIQYATHLTELKVGDAAADYENDNFVALTLGNNRLLRKLDVRNCTALTQTVDASGCTNIEEVYFDGTGIAGVSLPNGGILKKLHLPATVTDLTLRNQTKLEEFVMPSFANVTTLRLENVASCVDGWSILHQIPANSRVRMIGFDWTQEDAAAVLELYDYLDTMRGLDENGNNMDDAQMQGKIRIDSLTGAQLSEMQSRYPSIQIVYQHITSNLYFYDDTGATLLYTAAVADGGDGTYGGTTPTKASDAQYTYSFAGGWSLNPSGSANANALKAVTADRKVYAVFNKTVRTYTVYWKNGSTTLETDTNVPYGTVPTYNGSTPVYNGSGDAEDYEFSGWSPAVGAITGDTTYTAQFKYTGYIEDDWATIAANVTNNTHKTLYPVGSLKPVELTHSDGTTETIEMMVVGHDHDDLADGGKAGLTFVATSALLSRRAMSSDSVKATELTWENCKLRTYCNGELFSALPADLQNVVREVSKPFASTYEDAVYTSVDKCWLLSAKEAGKTATSDGSTYEGITDLASKVSDTVDGDFYTRSGAYTSNVYWAAFYAVQYSYTGSAYLDDLQSHNSAYVLFGFCVGESPVADTSWDNIAASIEDGSYSTKYKIGQVMPVDLGSEGIINMQIAAFDAEPLADGSGTAAISWVAKELLANRKSMNPALSGTTEGTGTIGGWEKCDARNSIMPTLLALFPSGLNSILVEVFKTHAAFNTSGSSFVQTTSDKLWIPALEEVYDSGGIYTNLFPDNTSRIKKTTGTSSDVAWWLRTASSTSSFRLISTSGSRDGVGAQATYGFCLGFCTGRTPT